MFISCYVIYFDLASFVFSHFQAMISFSDTGIIFLYQMKKTRANKHNSQIKPKPIQQNDILTLVHVVREGSKDSNLIL